MTSSPIRAFGATRQIAFHQLLVGARKKWLLDALAEALGAVDPTVLRTQIGQYAPADVQSILAGAGIRDEHVFPTPVVLEAQPTLVGYYRLLLGAPQKGFYGGGTGMGRFKSMEDRGLLNARQRTGLPEFCSAMSEPLADLVRQLSPTITQRDVRELPLLTIGSQFQGSNNNTIGQQATTDVFLAVAEIVRNQTTDHSARQVSVLNAAGRRVTIALAGDPDVRIQEWFGDTLRNKVAIEIKGGTDRSNAHNRAGEAEKSHQKAKNDGYRDFWTMIAKRGLDMDRLRQESPTTTSWFDVAEVIGRFGNDWHEFRSRIAEAVGIPVD